MSLVETMGSRIRELRIMRGLTQEDLGEIMYMRKSTISAYENDAIDIKSSVIIELARALHTVPGYFFVTDDVDNSEDEAVALMVGIKNPLLKRVALDHLKITRQASEFLA